MSALYSPGGQLLCGNANNSILSIIVETSKGTRIENEQTFEVDGFQLHEFYREVKKYTIVAKRRDESPLYNCHGLTFASRRTNIYNSCDVQQVLSDDGYIELSTDSVLAGDVIVYFDDKTGEISHSGEVVEIIASNSFNAIICSKWGQGFECLHTIHNTPYGNIVKFYRCKL